MWFRHVFCYNYQYSSSPCFIFILVNIIFICILTYSYIYILLYIYIYILPFFIPSSGHDPHEDLSQNMSQTSTFGEIRGCKIETLITWFIESFICGCLMFRDTSKTHLTTTIFFSADFGGLSRFVRKDVSCRWSIPLPDSKILKDCLSMRSPNQWISIPRKFSCH